MLCDLLRGGARQLVRFAGYEVIKCECRVDSIVVVGASDDSWRNLAICGDPGRLNRRRVLKRGFFTHRKDEPHWLAKISLGKFFEAL